MQFNYKKQEKLLMMTRNFVTAVVKSKLPQVKVEVKTGRLDWLWINETKDEVILYDTQDVKKLHLNLNYNLQNCYEFIKPFEDFINKLVDYYREGKNQDLSKLLLESEIFRFSSRPFLEINKHMWNKKEKRFVISPEMMEVFKKICVPIDDRTNVEELIFEEGILEIPTHFCGGCLTLKKVVLPSSLISLDPHAFYKCPNLLQIIYE